MQKRAFIGSGTQVCAVIGDPVAHSLSPAIHNAAFDALNLDFVYVAFRVRDVRGAVSGVRAMENFRGMSVTIPHKMEIMHYMDEISDLDRRIGSINTVLSEEGGLSGLGTDGPGALKAFQDAGCGLDGKKALFLGAGGVARAIAFTLAWNVSLDHIALLDIDEKLLAQLGDDLAAATPIPVLRAQLNEASLSLYMRDADLIIHCTPVGMYPHSDASLVPKELFRPGQVVFDAVYTPFKTRLLAHAQEKGLKTISGVEMFINQAVLQFEKFTGMPAPEKVMRDVVMAHLTS